MRNYVFLKNCVTSDGIVSHNVLYYQQLSIAHYQVGFHANVFFNSNYQRLVSSSFNHYFGFRNLKSPEMETQVLLGLL